MQFFPLPPPSECPLRGAAAALRPAEGRDAGPPPPADVPFIESIFFYQTFSPLSVDFPRLSSRRTRRLPSPREVGVRCPLYIIGVKQSADCLHAPPLRPFLPTDAVSRSKRHRGTLETPYPGPKQILRRWKCRIQSQNKRRQAGNAVSETKTNVGKPEMPYPEARGTPAPPRRLTKDRRKPRKSEKRTTKSPSACPPLEMQENRTATRSGQKKLTIFVGIL